MSFVSKKRSSKEKQDKYLNDVKKFFDDNIYRIIYGISLLEYISFPDYTDFKKIFGETFPKNPKYDEEDFKKQINCLLRTLKLNIFLEDGYDIQSVLKEYTFVVNDYAKVWGSSIFEKISKSLELFNGRLTYNTLSKILEASYPKISFAIEADERIAMLLFLYKLGFVFKFDSSYIFFL